MEADTRKIGRGNLVDSVLVGALCILTSVVSIVAYGAIQNRHREHFDWNLFLTALEMVEAPKTEAQAQAAIKREGAYGVLQIRQICLDDVNRRYGTKVTLAEVHKSRVLSRWVCVHYLKMYGADKYYDDAARTWNGGPKGKYKKATEPHWLRVKAAMLELKKDKK